MIITVFGMACSPTRRLQENEYLLVKSKVIETVKQPKNERDNISDYIQQRPNRKIFGFYRFHLQTYNLPNPNKLSIKKEKQLKRLEEKNQKIEAYNATVTNPKKKKKLKKERLLFGEWLQKIGEPPVILDSVKTDKTKRQLVKYAQNKGFFEATVRDSVYYNFKKKKAKVFYIIERGHAYYVDKIDRSEIKHPVLDTLIRKHDNKSELSENMKFDLEKFDAERERLTKIFRHNGFFLFRKDFIKYKADSSLGDYMVSLKMHIDDPDMTYLQNNDTVKVNQHKQFIIRRVYIVPDYHLSANPRYSDTTTFGLYHFLSNGKLRYRKKTLANAVFFLPFQLFTQRTEDRTQRALTELRNFKYVHIRYEPVFSDGKYDSLDCYVELSPLPRQNFGVDLQGTNTEGNLGVNVTLSYLNRNIFKSADLLEFRITAGAEVQVLQGDSSNIIDAGLGLGPFNTIELGSQLSLLTPRFLFPIPIKRFNKGIKPKTRFTLSVNYQARPDYNRLIGAFSFGYEWQQTNRDQTYTIRHIANPLELSLVYVNTDTAFDNYINEINDQFVKNSFLDHYIHAMSYTFLYNNQDMNNPLKNFVFIRANIQTGGNLLYLASLAIDATKDQNGSYLLEGLKIPFSQYVRTDVDFRYYFKFPRFHTLATRIFLGVGYPYGNSLVLPFEKSFFIGGANDLRAWLPRTMGPGSFPKDTAGRVDQVGDIKILLNAEYRFKIYKFIEGAVFADFGNIWLIRADNDRPNGHFDFSRFWNEFAFGAGVGIRLNFNFFIFRLDVALPMRDPRLPQDQRWVIKDLKFRDVRFNIGIGYPF